VPRICPRDDTPLHEQRAGRVNVDVCPKCHGTFLDGIELKRVLGDQNITLALADSPGSKRSPVDCPACGSALFLDRVGDVELDHCKECLGVWLDAGEVERLAARAILLAARAAKVHLEETLTDVASELRGGT
jgi:Zn-finger nucleic acid-binding protein